MARTVWLSALNTAYQRRVHPQHRDLFYKEHVGLQLQRAFLLGYETVVLTPDQALDHLGLHRFFEAFEKGGAQANAFERVTSGDPAPMSICVRSDCGDLNANLQRNLENGADWVMFPRMKSAEISNSAMSDRKRRLESFLLEELAEDGVERSSYSIASHISRLRRFHVQIEPQPVAEFATPLGEYLTEFSGFLDEYFPNDRVAGDIMELLSENRECDSYGQLEDAIFALRDMHASHQHETGFNAFEDALVRANEMRRTRQCGADLCEVQGFPSSGGHTDEYAAVLDRLLQDYLTITHDLQNGAPHSRKVKEPFPWPVIATLAEREKRDQWNRAFEAIICTPDATLKDVSMRVTEVLMDLTPEFRAAMNAKAENRLKTVFASGAATLTLAFAITSSFPPISVIGAGFVLNKFFAELAKNSATREVRAHLSKAVRSRTSGKQ